jgi:hypothetical protein
MRLTKKTIGCFEYDLKDHKSIPGEFGTYEAFFDYSTAVSVLGQYENLSEDPAKLASDLAELEEYRAADEAGLMVKLPCKVGTKIYVVSPNNTVREMFFNLAYHDPNDFGKTVFLTREASKAELEGRG